MPQPGTGAGQALVRPLGRVLRTGLLAVALVGGFCGLVHWFGSTDVYHQHFFHAGTLIAGYNLARVAFAAYLAWLVYFAGHIAVVAADRSYRLRSLSLAERFVLGFVAGAGIWHVALLALGVAGLYYRSLMAVICVVVLLLSVKHFEAFAGEALQWMGAKASAWRGRKELALACTVALIALAAGLLLVVRGLYPGGSHDYYTHYFYYYHDVIRNHGLAPNDVWYQYYYSKGAGLYYLAILLTDLQAPETVTFCCVAVAALGLATLTARIAPDSLWPAVGAVLYLLYLLCFGGEFQKLHEQLSALVALAVWAACMCRLRPRVPDVPCFVAAASGTVAVAILTPSMGALLAVVFGVCAAWARARGATRQFRGYVLVGAAAGCATASVLALNYGVTGLALDQGLDLTWRLANLERLDEWGVIPQVALIAWIRDNYAHLASSVGEDALGQLRGFMRLDELRLFLYGGLVALAIAACRPRRFAGEGWLTREVLVAVGLFAGTLAVISAVLGRSQSVSYLRFSTFFFPLLSLFAVACWASLLGVWRDGPRERLLRLTVPGLLLILVPLSWHFSTSATKRTAVAAGHAFNFAAGRYSLAEGYSKQGGRGGPAYGAIHPGALAAMRRAGPGTRIWSMHVATYCLVPECRIESVSSFKLSPRLNEILNGPPAEARRILAEEGLDYFLYSKDAQLLDLLPYSRLFAPANIADYLGVAWTDGTSWLLTWRGRGTLELDRNFMESYTAKLREREHPWFRFSDAVPAIDRVMKTLEASPRPWRPIEFPWRQPRGGGWSPNRSAADDEGVDRLHARATLEDEERIHVELGDLARKIVREPG